MRTSDHNYLKRQFRKEIDCLITHFERVTRAIASSKHAKADTSRIAESVFVSAYVSFEGFLSNLFVAYINCAPARFLEFNENRIRQSAQDKFGEWHAGRLSFSSVRHIKVDTLRGILDPGQRNITFGSTAKIKERANEILARANNRRIQALSVHDASVIDTAKAIRDYISHRSDSAYREMNQQLQRVDQGPPNRHLGRGENEIQAVGSFLKAETQTEKRVILYLGRLRDISALL